jgi:phenylacetate-CoA ligase
MRKNLIFAVVLCAALVRECMMRRDWKYKLLFMPGTSRFRTVMGLWKAWYALEKARRRCPAYADYFAANGGKVVLNGWIPDLSGVPEMDKARYIKRYKLAQTLIGGELPDRGAVIDQSSGSSGKATSWVRGLDERKAVARVMQIALRQFAGKGKKILFINAFALGPWATGMAVSYSVSDECLLISTGPDINKIVGALEEFGSDKFIYIIAGYPPFLKMLVDRPDVNLKPYHTIAFYGGEGMPEGMRTYLMDHGFNEVYGDYGASDLEINIGAENPFTVALRRAMESNPMLRKMINWHVSKLPGLERLSDELPHIFQYNQLDYVVESNSEGELVITVCRASNISPRIRYNIHDNGFVITLDKLMNILREASGHGGFDVASLPPPIANLPVMFHYGRSDLSEQYYGCKIPPTDIINVVYQMPELASIYSSFAPEPWLDKVTLDKHLDYCIELQEGRKIPEDIEGLTKRFFELLGQTNQDYRESARIALEKGIVNKLKFYEFRTGPFEGADIRTKYKYSSPKS